MNQTEFNKYFNANFLNAVKHSFTQIQLPPPSVINTSWNVVKQRIEQNLELSEEKPNNLEINLQILFSDKVVS
ncbi:MAG: hypothetical protein JWM44_2239 [Bacilli bacterium]|nr:hypothetical protein [Bacilli bacterium]